MAERIMILGAGPVGLPSPDPDLCAVVVVPARDEAERIGACLLALSHQREVMPGSFEVIVILDGCHDNTAEVVEELTKSEPGPSVHTVELASSEGVGRARRLGMDLACQRLLGLGRDEGLIASTDADSVVAPDWLARQLELTRFGAQAIGGHIELHSRESGALVAEALVEREQRSVERMRTVLGENPSDGVAEHHQFSGASLALTAGAYRRCGGLP
ncbi:MAG: glycosyltransferase family A protein, partial [Solirubrobacteraceae bacterium]